MTAPTNLSSALAAWRALPAEKREANFVGMERTIARRRADNDDARGMIEVMDAALAVLRAAVEPEAPEEDASTPFTGDFMVDLGCPKMNEDERQCFKCGRVYHEDAVHENVCMDCAVRR